MPRAGCTPPKLRNNQIPREISDIVMKALAPEVGDRYQRAAELLDDLATAGEIDHKATELDDIRKRLKAREVPEARLLLALPQAAARPLQQLVRSAANRSRAEEPHRIPRPDTHPRHCHGRGRVASAWLWRGRTGTMKTA